MVLPNDPEGNAVPLDQEALAWLKEPRPAPYGGRNLSWGSSERGASSAIVLYDQYRHDAGWARYMALHRHGGIEAGAGHLTHQVQNVRIFALRPIVGLAWAVVALQSEVAGHWKVQAPYELTIAIRNTGRATWEASPRGGRTPDRACSSIGRAWRTICCCATRSTTRSSRSLSRFPSATA